MTIVILCIGNIEGGDDGIGPFLAQRLIHEQLPYEVINAETVPENYTGVIKQKKPDQLLIIDAVDMQLQPGSIRIVPKGKIGSMHISTHGIPLSVFISYLEQYIPTITLIGIQPKTITGDLSSEVHKAGMHLLTLLKYNKIRTIPTLH